MSIEPLTLVTGIILFLFILLGWLLHDARRRADSMAVGLADHRKALEDERALSKRRLERANDYESRLISANREIQTLRKRAQVVERMEKLIRDLGQRDRPPVAMILRVGFAGDSIATSRTTEPPSSTHTSQGNLSDPIPPILDVL